MRKIPEHLAHLDTTPAGIPIPWINLRGREEPERMKIGYDRAARGVAAYIDEDRTQPVDFTKACIQRQRQSMVFRLCQVCARPLEWGATGLVVSRLSTEIIDLHAEKVVVCTEPWLCPDCAFFAIKTCPALIRRKRADDLVLVTVSSAEECQLVMSSGWIDGPYEESTKREPVFMWAKVMIFEWELKAIKP